MLPPIDQLLSIGMIRDGGSLGASLLCADGSVYALFFKLDSFVNAGGELERRGYFPPVIMRKVCGIEISISWPHAEILLHQMRAMLRSEADRNWVEVMIEVTETRGQLPASISKIVGKPIRLTSL
jgi:hypothetical protein